MNTKAAAERHQRMLNDLSKQPGNDTCADCGGRAPRWASWNLGIFICMQCAGVHRKMGTHISKVKSLTLDTWTREQVERMKSMGNAKSNSNFISDPLRTRPPMNVDEAERNSELERFIFDKYRGRFIDRKPPPVPVKDASSLRPFPPGSPQPGSRRREPSSPSPSASSIMRSATAPIPSTSRSTGSSPTQPSAATMTRNGSLAPPQVDSLTNGLASGSYAAPSGSRITPNLPPRASSSQGMPSSTSAPATSSATARSSVFDDLVSLSTDEPMQPQPPIQMNGWATLQQQQQQQQQQQMAAAAAGGSMNGAYGSGLAAHATGLGQSAFGGAGSMGMNGSGAYQQQGPANGLGSAGGGGASHGLPTLSFTPATLGQEAFSQLQQQQQAVAQGYGASSPGMFAQQGRSASLGAMAFTPGGNHLLYGGAGSGNMSPGANPFFNQQQHQQLQAQATGFMPSSPGVMMGQSAFGGMGAMTSPMQMMQQPNGYFGQQQQQQAANGAFGSPAMSGGHVSPAFGQGQQPQPQQQQPQQPGSAFGAWAEGFMPNQQKSPSNSPWG